MHALDTCAAKRNLSFYLYNMASATHNPCLKQPLEANSVSYPEALTSTESDFPMQSSHCNELLYYSENINEDTMEKTISQLLKILDKLQKSGNS